MLNTLFYFVGKLLVIDMNIAINVNVRDGVTGITIILEAEESEEEYYE